MGEEPTVEPHRIEIKVEGNAVGSTLIAGNGNTVTVVYSAEVVRAHLTNTSNPYRGLSAFDESSSQFFFGRELLARTLFERLEHLTSPIAARGGTRLLAIMGPSGCGKSSVARAGILPKLAIAESSWLRGARAAIMRPGSSPVDALADALARLVTGQPNPYKERDEFASTLREHARSGLNDGLSQIVSANRVSGPLLLLIDQFEETYTLCRSPQQFNKEGEASTKTERDTFVNTVIEAASRRNGAVSVLLTLRSDFYGALSEHPRLSAIVAENSEIVPAMSRDDLRRALAEPARVLRHPIDTATVERILDQAAGEATALPLVQYSLEQIWERMRDGTAPADSLTALGGIGGALANRADEVLHGLSREAQFVAERAFLSTIQLGDTSARDTRRRALLEEFIPLDKTEDYVRMALEPFVRARLLAMGALEDRRTWIELPHEALTRYWQNLRNWIDRQRDDLRFARRLQEAAAIWNQSNRPTGSLWRRPDLDLLRRYEARNRESLTGLHVEFLAASNRRAALERWMSWGSAAAIMVLIPVAAGFAWVSHERETARQAEAIQADVQKHEAEQKAHLASAQALAEQALAASGTHPQLSILLAVEAARMKALPLGSELSTLRQVLSQSGGLVIGLHNAITSMAVGSRFFLTGSVDGKGRVWRVNSPDPASTPIDLVGHSNRIDAVALSSDERFALTGSLDGTVRLWDLNASDPSTSAQIISFTQNDILSVHKVAFSPDMRWIAVAANGRATLWHLRDGRVVGNGIAPNLGNEDSSTFLFGADSGKIFVAAGSKIFLIDLASPDFDRNPTGLEIGSHTDSVYAIDLSLGGDWLASASSDKTVRLWNLSTPPRIKPGPVLQHIDAVDSVKFSPDGHWLATAGWGTSGDHAVYLWNMHAREFDAPDLILRGHAARIKALVFSKDGHFLFSASEDHTIRRWDMTAPRPQDGSVILRGHEKDVEAMAITSDGLNLISASLEHWDSVEAKEYIFRIWNFSPAPSTAEPTIIFNGGETNRVFTSGDGHWLVALRYENPPLLWSLDQPLESQEPIKLLGHTDNVESAYFSRDGRWLATASWDSTVRLWDLQSKLPGSNPIVLTGPKAQVNSVIITPDGRWVVAAGWDNGVWVWDLTRPADNYAPRKLEGHHGRVFEVAIADDGLWLASGDDNGTLIAWQVGTWAPTILRDHEGKITSLNFEGHTHRLLESGWDKAIRIWNLDDADATAGPLDLGPNPGPVDDAASTTDGRWIVSAGWASDDLKWETSGRTRIALWDLKDRSMSSQPRLLLGHEGHVEQVAISPDNRWAATVGQGDETVRLWDLASENPAVSPQVIATGLGPQSVAFSNDGRSLFVATQGEIERWHLSVGDLDDLSRKIAGRNLSDDEWSLYFAGLPYRLTYPDLPKPLAYDQLPRVYGSGGPGPEASLATANKPLSDLVSKILDHAPADDEICRDYAKLLEANPTLLSGTQIEWAKSIMARREARARKEAIVILALSGDKRAEKVIDLSVNPSEGDIANWVRGFLSRQGRDLSLTAISNLPPASLDYVELMALPKGSGRYVDWAKVLPGDAKKPELVLGAKVQDDSLAAVAYAYAMGGRPKSAMIELVSELLRSRQAYGAAEIFIEEAAKITPNDPAIENMWGNIEQDQSHFEEAIHHYERSEDLGRNDGWPQFNLAQLYEKLGQFDFAESQYRAALSKHDTTRSKEEYAEFLNGFAWFISQRRSTNTNKLNEALAASQSALGIAKKPNANYLDTLAAVYYALGNRQAAAKTEALALEALRQSGQQNKEIETAFKKYSCTTTQCP